MKKDVDKESLINKPKEISIIETEFYNKKAKKKVKQCLVKIPKIITDKMHITKANKIRFEIIYEYEKPVLKMRLV